MKMFLFGMLVMSVFTFLALKFLDDGKDSLALFFGGPIVWIWVFGGGLLYRISKRCVLAFFNKHYSEVILIDENKSYDKTYYIRNELLDAFYKKEDHHFAYIKDIRPSARKNNIVIPERIVTKKGMKNGCCDAELKEAVRPYSDLYNKL